MSRKYFDVFKKPNDHRNWDKQIEYASIADEIAEEERLKIISGLQFLKTELGDRFIRDCKNAHPIIQKLSDPPDEFLRFTDTLQRIKETEGNLSFLVNKKLIPNNACWQEGRHFVHVAKFMIDAGLDVRFIEENYKESSPDIEITDPDTDEKFYIEVTKVEASDNRQIRTDNYHKLFQLLHRTMPSVPFSCRQLSVIQEEEFPSVEEKINELKRAAIDQQKLITHQDEKLLIAFAPTSQMEMLNKWDQENNKGRMDLVGLPQNFDDTHRIKNNKIKPKAKQLKNCGTGLIYMPVHYYYFWVINFPEVAKELNAKMHEFPNLLGIVLFSIVKEQIKEAIDYQNDYIYSRVMLTNLLRRDLLFVQNEKYEGELSEDCLKKILKSFLPEN